VNEKKVYTVMDNNSTYINKINNCLSPQTIEHKIFHDIWDWKSRSLLVEAHLYKFIVEAHLYRFIVEAHLYRFIVEAHLYRFFKN
jgi:hypothetical protein